MTCGQAGCDNVAMYRVYWPGSNPIDVCKEHVATAEGIARSLGFYLHIEEIYEPSREGQGDSKGSKGEVY